MAFQVLPLIVAAGAVAVLSGKKKKRSGPKSGQKCDPELDAPTGFSCDDGLLSEEPVDESDLDSEGDLSKDDVGDFDVEEQDVRESDDEESGEPGGEAPEPEVETDPSIMCEEFMTAIHAVPSSEDELPIHPVAVEETALPAMKAAAAEIASNMGIPLDPEAVGPALVLDALKALIPVCSWKYDPDEDEFTYNDGRGIETDAAKDVLFGLVQLSVSVIDGINNPVEMTFQETQQGPIQGTDQGPLQD